MKKTKLLLVFTALLCIFGMQKAKAQITSVSINPGSRIDSLSHSCIPSDLMEYWIIGSVTGTLSPTGGDSLTVKFYFGDGTSETYKSPIGTSKSFNIHKGYPKIYTVAGTYTTKVVVTAASGVADSLSSSPFTLGTSCSITFLAINKTTSKIDSLSGLCSSKNLTYRVLGTVAGTIGKLDSLTVFFDFGDGTNTTYKVPLTSWSFNIYKSSTHTYATAGTYTTKVIITAPSGVKDSMSSAPFTIASGTLGITSTKLYAYGFSDSMDALCRLPFTYYYGASGSVMGCKTGVDTAVVNFNFGDGTDTTIVSPMSSLATSYYTSGFNHLYTTAGTYTPRVTVIIKSSGVKDTVFLTSFTLNDSCATVHGNLYVDDNKNCVKNTGEVGAWYVPIRVINTVTGDTTYAYKWSDTAGNYSIDLPAGSYNVTPMVNRTYYGWWYGSSTDTLKPSCPTSGSVTLTVAPLASYTRDFAYECKPVSSFDASVLVSSNCYVPGDTSLMKVWAGDWWKVYYYNCLSLTSSVTLTLDSKLSYAGHYDGKAPASVVGKVITWNLSGTDLAHFSSRVKVAVATTATLGDTLRSTAYVAPATGVTDPNTTNNTYVYSREVVSAFDPNMKEAAPSGKGKEGFIGKNTPMTYTIHFQNTGTAPARNITILDTLESDLVASSFHMISSTHNAVVYQEGKVLKFRFNNIYLPDSNADYYGSMGSVTFGILPVRDLVAGTEIKNRAGIYFDYNEPIITNYALNTIDNTTSIQHISLGNLAATVYPNPANTLLNISVANNASISVTMVDMLGRTIANEQSQNGNIGINTQNLAAGMYLLNIRDAEGNQQNTKVMVKH